MKCVFKIFIMWFLIVVGLIDKIVLKIVMDLKILLYNLDEDFLNLWKKFLFYVKILLVVWLVIYNIVFVKKIKV